MSLKITDVKPGDVIRYFGESVQSGPWYCLICQTYNNKLTYLWISGNSREELHKQEAFRWSDIDMGTPLEAMLLHSTKVAYIDNTILINTLKGLDKNK